jgi:hypothetical protein
MTYEAPELFELGDAKDLTQWVNEGWRMDHAQYPRIPFPVSDEPEDEA